MIDISGLNKAEVLATLFNHSKQQGMGFLDVSGARKMTVEDARGYIEQDPKMDFDYLRGRVMKVRIKDDTFDPWLYDRDNGEGAAERAIDSIR